MKTMRRSLAVLMALLLIVGMPLSAMAAEYDLNEGSVTVSAGAGGQTVTHKEVSTPDNNPVITSKGTQTSNTITLTSTGDATAKVTIENVNISSGGNSAIDVTSGSKAEITVSGGNNTVKIDSYDKAAIHVGDAQLTIQGGGTDDKLTVQSKGDSYGQARGAVVGSNKHENFSGSIQVSDVTLDVTNAEHGAGAAIGSSNYSQNSGSIQITDAVVEIASPYTTGIGSGDCAPFAGQISIEGSQVTVQSDESCIGSSWNANFVQEGQITIHDSRITADSTSSVAIGAGQHRSLDGNIAITGSTQILTDDAIGSSLGNGSGAVSVGPNAQLYSHDGTNQREWADAVQGAKIVFIEETVVSDTAPEGDAIPEGDTFWDDTIRQIRAARKGETITVDVGGRTTMPRAVMDAIAETGVILVIHWQGGEDIVIDKPYTGEKQIWVFSLRTLPHLLAN